MTLRIARVAQKVTKIDSRLDFDNLCSLPTSSSDSDKNPTWIIFCEVCSARVTLKIMPPGVGIPYDPSDLSQHIHAQLEGLGELAIYLTRSVSSRGAASAGPSQVKAAFAESTQLERTEKKEQVAEMEMALRRVHLGDEWWVDMTEQEMLGYLERKEKGECEISTTTHKEHSNEIESSMS